MDHAQSQAVSPNALDEFVTNSIDCPYCGHQTVRKGMRTFGYIGRPMVRYYCNKVDGCSKYHLRDPLSGDVFQQPEMLDKNNGHFEKVSRVPEASISPTPIVADTLSTPDILEENEPVFPVFNFRSSFSQFAKSASYLNEGNSYLIFVMSLLLDEPNAANLASECLTDGNNDKKIDFIKLDRDNKRIVISQGYYSKKSLSSAPANKASDLNSASAWLVSGDVSLIPHTLRSVVLECRSAMDEGDIEEIQLVYVHNLPESKNVRNELETAANHLKSVVSSYNITVSSKEIGRSSAERLFIAHQSPIAVQAKIECNGLALYKESGPAWEATVLSVPGKWLHDLYQAYGDEMFSANYRGFLGVNKRRKINSGIRQSAESEPENFWVYNNGITILTHDITPDSKGKLILNGISIINGAQTTGSISSIDLTRHNLDGIRVLCRLIKCSDPTTVANIVKYNNTQNEIKNWDQYSNDSEQIRIEGEFREIGHNYSRKRGFSKVADASIGVEDVSTSLVAFQGRFTDANRGKNLVFERKQLYQLAFDGKTARHILFVASLSAAIDQRRIELKNRSSSGEIIDQERRQLELLRNLRFKNFFISVCAACLDTILRRPVNRSSVAFTGQAAHRNNHSLEDLTSKWQPIVRSVLTFIAAVIGEDESTNAFSQENGAVQVIEKVAAMLYAQDNPAFDSFREIVAL